MEAVLEPWHHLAATRDPKRRQNNAFCARLFSDNVLYVTNDMLSSGGQHRILIKLGWEYNKK